MGEAIRTQRKRAGLTQEKLAEKADLNPKYLGEVECGYVNISVDALARIARALGVKVRKLTLGF